MGNPIVPQSLMTKHQVNVLGIPRKNFFNRVWTSSGDTSGGDTSGGVDGTMERYWSRIHTSFFTARKF